MKIEANEGIEPKNRFQIIITQDLRSSDIDEVVIVDYHNNILKSFTLDEFEAMMKTQ